MTTMKALLLETTDGPEAVAVRDVAIPTPGPGEVRVAIKAASVNHRELFIAHGQYPGMTLPSVMGCDGAGVVDMLGEGVSGASLGDEVILYPARQWGPRRDTPAADFGLLGMPFPGTIAEYVCVPAENLAPKPAFMTWEEAGAMPYTIIVVASASDSASNQYLAPFAGAAIGELGTVKPLCAQLVRPR